MRNTKLSPEIYYILLQYPYVSPFPYTAQAQQTVQRERERERIEMTTVFNPTQNRETEQC